MSNWIEREEQHLCNDLNNGIITQKEFDFSMRELMAEATEAAQEAADETYDNYFR